ncbi:flagellar regulator YcgR PilZN domain-containing protein [Pseudoduganella guangdongensis]|uniref:flagellar regulator YcgR PilZN domain-containing protein n=1 Tax=Pseudoduganella guangdongensis TaxID=2692179 RepID=UPI001E560D9E|nr:flagellar regulator YcgR PilZN domain-containing protein [Pseudoduganella guangdongensis]
MPFPPTSTSYDMTTEDDIGDALTLLAENGDAISMYAPGSREPVLGRILSVDPELPHFVMQLNEGETLPSGDITFVACLRTAKLQFRLSGSWKSTPGQAQLVPMVFPETCAVLNRRNSVRVESPLGANFTAAFVMNGTPFELPVYDFAHGGIGLRCSRGDAKGLLKGRKLRDIVLELGDAEPVFVAEMEIRATRSYRSFLLGEQLHIGCQFTSMTPEAVEQVGSLMARISAKR